MTEKEWSVIDPRTGKWTKPKKVWWPPRNINTKNDPHCGVRVELQDGYKAEVGLEFTNYDG